MAELKTKLTDASVEKFLDTVPDAQKRADCFALLDLMKQASKAEPKMWAVASLALGVTTINMPVAARATGCWSASRRASKI